VFGQYESKLWIRLGLFGPEIDLYTNFITDEVIVCRVLE
jgi:hypothetical protein